MKTYILITLLILTIKIGTSQNWHWAKQIGGNNDDSGITSVDSENNIYCYGYFYNSSFFQTDTIYSNGVNDLFLAKYDESGNKLWVKGFGGDNPYNPSTNSYDERRSNITIDNNNNSIYITGKFRNQMIIDGHSVISKGSLDYFIAKFDLNGTCLWIKRAGSSSNDFYSTTVNVQDNGNVLWTVTLDNSGTIDTANVVEGTYILSYNTNGSLLNNTKLMVGASVTKIDFYNNEIYLLGRRYDTLTIDTFITTKGPNIFAKLDSNLNIKWVSTISGYANSFLKMDNNLYLTGQFNTYLIINDSIIVTNSATDLYLSKFDDLGNLLWTRQSNTDGVYGASSNGIISENDTNFYIYGYFNGNASLGDYNISTTNISDGFVAKYNINGECEGVFNFGLAKVRRCNIDSNGELIVSGDIGNVVNFGNTILSSYSGSVDMFFAKCDAITTVGKAKNTTINNQLVIYANPMQGKCNITVPDEFANEKELNLKIYDNTGKQLQNAKLVMIDNKVKIDLNNEAKGIYNVVLSNGKKNYNGKIVFE